MSTPPLSLHAWLRYDAAQRLLPAGTRRVLEIGAGLGSFGLLLARRFDYVGLEPDPASFERASRRLAGHGTVLDETAESYAPDDPFDLVCAFEVLEHVEDDVAALTGWLRHLRPGGHVLLSVPVDRERFGPWDRRAGHYRRYDPEDIVTTMERAGLTSVETVVYGFPLGRALEAGRNVAARLHEKDGSMEELTASSGRQYQPPAWTAAATRVASAPFRVLQRPFSGARLGTGIVARGRLAPV